ncbi:Hypothetical predicted protein [Cloeon dipterum]|nr:Hypothetical predicted protein [Cloeon dipterum]
MERKEVIWTAVLSSLLALLALVAALYACYWWQKRKRKQEEEEEAEPVVMQHPTSSLSRLNGILSLKTPLISTKALGAQLETAGTPNKTPSGTSSNLAGTSIPEGKSAGATSPAPQNKALQNVKNEHPSTATEGAEGNRSISLVDMYIDNSEPSENVGQIHFSLEYDFQNTTLILRIIQVRQSAFVLRRVNATIAQHE